MKLPELLERTGASARQVRYLIAERFVPRPTGGRARARYGDEHIAAIRRYTQLRDLGFTPASIRILLRGRQGVPFPVTDGITLVVAPELVASGTPAEPVAAAAQGLLTQVLARSPGDVDSQPTTGGNRMNAPAAAPALRDPIEAFVARRHRSGPTPPVPLTRLDLSVTIRGGLAVVETTRTYTNHEGDPIEALLTLPVPVHAAFFGLTATIGGVLHRGEAHARRAARDRYEEAIQDGTAAVLHEELLRGVHSLSLGNLGPGDSAEVTMRWAEVLRCSGPLGRLRIPMTVGDVYGCSGLEDVDELVHGGGTLIAGLRVVHDARDVRVEGPRHRAGPDVGPRGQEPHEGAAFAAKVPCDAPVDLLVDGWRSGEVRGRRWDGTPVALGIEPAGHGGEPLNVAVLLDRSGSMDGLCEGSGARRVSKHQAAVEAIADLGRRLRREDRIALWQFDTDCEAVGPERPGPVGDVPALVERFGGPRGGTEIGAALGRCMRRAGVRDILLVTDGKSHALDPHALAREGRRVFAVLVGEDSLEANVGHLAALTGGDVRFTPGGDAGRALADILAGLRTNAETPTAGNVRVRTIVSAAVAEDETPAGPVRSVVEEAVGAYAAYLELAKLDADEAADLAESEGLVTHLTSLCIVDEEGVRHEGLPEMRKLALASPRVASMAAHSVGAEGQLLGIAMERPVPHASASVREYDAVAYSPSEPLPSQPEPPFDEHDPSLEALAAALSIHDPSLAPLARRIAWARHARALAGADLSGLSDGLAARILALCENERIEAFADRVGIEPLAVAIAVLAHLAKAASRHAGRVFRSIVGGVGPRGP